MFQFKQFAIDQTGCAMKINTDGVLLGALANADNPQTVLDIGTGTGVIALMLAQRFPSAQIDAVEIDSIAAATAERNFKASVFTGSITCYHSDFGTFLRDHPEKQYDLIVSNPPFYINSLKSLGEQKTVAKHADGQFFDNLIKSVSAHISDKGLCWLILPVDTSELVKQLAISYKMHPVVQIDVRSYPHSEPHRQILAFSKFPNPIKMTNFIIYKEPKQYTDQYIEALKNFFTIF